MSWHKNEQPSWNFAAAAAAFAEEYKLKIKNLLRTFSMAIFAFRFAPLARFSPSSSKYCCFTTKGKQFRSFSSLCNMFLVFAFALVSFVVSSPIMRRAKAFGRKALLLSSHSLTGAAAVCYFFISYWVHEQPWKWKTLAAKAKQ